MHFPNEKPDETYFTGAVCRFNRMSPEEHPPEGISYSPNSECALIIEYKVLTEFTYHESKDVFQPENLDDLLCNGEKSDDKNQLRLRFAAY
ncbi:hypothetical protein K3495_g9494 [Podosphaera aphanis]|nr:hypothetical protein K3495_g9494 [Podosphaera aphanis]